jgi:hypothetical protein
MILYIWLKEKPRSNPQLPLNEKWLHITMHTYPKNSQVHEESYHSDQSIHIETAFMHAYCNAMALHNLAHFTLD